MDDLIVVTNHEPVDKEEFYLSNEWGKNAYGRLDEVKQARKLQKEGKLYHAYVVRAKDYALYWQMDADEIFIDDNDDEVLRAESSVIGNEHSHKWEYEY
jgi:hypothetical protein